MQTNAVPPYDDSVNTTGCCSRFNPVGWDGQELHLDNKQFIRATTKSLMHIPLNMAGVFGRVQRHIENAGAYDPDNCIVLSRDQSAWKAEHLFSIAKPVPEEEAVTLTGNFITKVFEGPYRQAKDWQEEMKELARARGGTGDEVYFFYTTCPKCAKAYGKNYVVGVARV
ncbi:MAG: hydrolase [Rhizobiaceae bacterium]